MGKCTKCGSPLGIFTAKVKLNDGLVCSSCFQKVEAENKKIMKDYIKKYLSNKDADFYYAIKDIYARSAPLKLEPYSLEEVKNHFLSWQMNYGTNKAGLDMDVFLFLKKNSEASLLFLADLEKLGKIFHNKGIEVDYLKIIALFIECMDEEFVVAVTQLAEGLYEPARMLLGVNPTQIGIVRYVMEISVKNGYSSDFIIGIIRKLFEKFNLQGDERTIKELMNKLEENDELADFEETLTSQQEVNIGDFERLGGLEFESYIQKLFQILGYTVVKTKASGDQGADLIISKDNEKIAVQAKKYSGGVSNKAIQEVVAAKNYYKTDGALVITNSFYTKGAIDLALANKVELWDGKKLNAIINDLNKPCKKSATDYLQEGINSDDPDKAIEAFSKALEIQPDFGVAYTLRGQAYFDNDEFERAIADCNKAVALRPNDLQSLLIRGISFAKKGDIGKAEIDFTVAIENNDGHSELYQAYVNRGKICMSQQAIDKALADFSKAIECKSDYAEGYQIRAGCYYIKEQYDCAWRDIHKAEELGFSVEPKLIEELKKASGRTE